VIEGTFGGGGTGIAAAEKRARTVSSVSERYQSVEQALMHA